MKNVLQTWATQNEDRVQNRIVILENSDVASLEPEQIPEEVKNLFPISCQYALAKLESNHKPRAPNTKALPTVTDKSSLIRQGSEGALSNWKDPKSCLG
jgi:hypothetical protein